MPHARKQPRYTATPRIEKPLGVWEDATSYTQSDPYPRVPRSWRLRLTRDIQIYVGSEHIYCKGEWIVTCSPWFDVKQIDLKVTPDNAREAQHRALGMVREKVIELAVAIGSTTTV